MSSMDKLHIKFDELAKISNITNMHCGILAFESPITKDYEVRSIFSESYIEVSEWVKATAKFYVDHNITHSCYVDFCIY